MEVQFDHGTLWPTVVSVDFISRGSLLFVWSFTGKRHGLRHSLRKLSSVDQDYVNLLPFVTPPTARSQAIAFCSSML